MDLSPEERKRIYQEEKAKAEAEEAARADSARAGSGSEKFLDKKRPAWHLVIAVPAILFGLLIVLAVIGSLVDHGGRATGSSQQPSPAASGASGAPYAPSSSLHPGERAVVYGSWVMATDERAYEVLDTSISDALDVYQRLALEDRIENCFPGDQPGIERTSVLILAVRPASNGKIYPEVRITGILRDGQALAAEPTKAGFTDEDQTGSPRDCFFLEGQPPNAGHRWVNAIGSVGYLGGEDRFYPVDAEGHDLRFPNVQTLPVSKSELLSLYGSRAKLIGAVNTGGWTEVYTYNIKDAALELEQEATERNLARVSLKFSISSLKAGGTNNFVAAMVDCVGLADEVTGTNIFAGPNTARRLGFDHAYDPGPDEVAVNGVRVRRYVAGGLLVLEFTPAAPRPRSRGSGSTPATGRGRTDARR